MIGGNNTGFGQVAFGTISGGVAADLTGGNFWQGAFSGFAVSMMNHMMHMAEKKNFIKNRLNSAGYNENSSIEMSDSALSEFGQKVFPDLYSESGEPEFLINDSIDGYGETRPACKSCTLFNKKIQVNIHPRSFKDNYMLASVVGHELIHAGDLFSGRYDSWVAIKNEDYAKNMTEVNAYEWNLFSNSLFSNYKTYTTYKTNLGQNPLPQTQYFGPQY